ncbi:MAG TPA: M13 family metallopeptidase N-terminal domain-containing protein [Polyangiaceae bacterium]|nr:M13 family metallopeptidase N-terminal domain-containing protein [Polyangiaceae bacterium]
MRRSYLTCFFGASLGCSAATTTPAGSPAPEANAAAPAPSAAASGATLESVGLDSLALDRSADACSNFYQFACGGWLEKTEIPPDESRWTRSFQEINKRNELELKRVLEAAASAPASSPNARAIGTFYGACMDESNADALGAKPIAPLLEKAGSVKDVPSVVRVVTELHTKGIWAVFDVSPVQDPSDATRWLAGFDQAGLGLPDRDYYLKDDAESQKIRAFYQGHVERMLALAGVAPAKAKQGAAAVLRIETELAKVSKSRVERRDPKGMFNRLDQKKLAQLTPAIDWKAYQTKLGAAVGPEVNVTAPKFFEGVQVALKSIEPSAWQAYLQWHVVRDAARTLSKPFVDEQFALDQQLTGQAEQRPRWRRCVAATNEALGDLLGEAFVETNFAGESKSAAVAMVHAISGAFGTELDRLEWMDDVTRKRAHEKLDAMAYLIGYPAKWKTYDFEIDPKNYAENTLRASCARWAPASIATSGR